MADVRVATADLSTLDRGVLEALIAAQQQEILSNSEALADQQEKLLRTPGSLSVTLHARRTILANRRARTRTHGGGTGKASDRLHMSIP